MDGAVDPGIQAAVGGELALLDPAVRAVPARAAALLHPDFCEVGASGRRWERAEILDAMAGELSLAGEDVRVSDVRAVRLAEDVVHLTYATTTEERTSLRSSLWRRVDGRWLLFFHQGTRAALE